MSTRFPSPFQTKKKQHENLFSQVSGKPEPTNPTKLRHPNFFETSPHLHGGVAQIRTGAPEVATKLLADLGWDQGAWKGFWVITSACCVKSRKFEGFSS